MSESGSLSEEHAMYNNQMTRWEYNINVCIQYGTWFELFKSTCFLNMLDTSNYVKYRKLERSKKRLVKFSPWLGVDVHAQAVLDNRLKLSQLDSIST